MKSFLDIPCNKMSPIILWVACYRKLNDRHAYPLLLKKMFELFIEIEKDLQIKVQIFFKRPTGFGEEVLKQNILNFS